MTTRGHGTRLLVFGWCVVVVMLGMGRPANADTISVSNTNDQGSGSLRQAILDAAPGDTIDFAGLGGCPCTITLTTGELVIWKAVTILGPGPGMLAVSGGNTSRIFRIDGDIAAHLEAFTVRDGSVEQFNRPSRGPWGGGILSAGRLTLVNMVVTNNRAERHGGGIFSSGALTVRDSSFVSNSSGLGGGGVYVDGPTTIAGSTFTGNSGYDGGGIFNDGGLITLVKVIVTENRAFSTGGGIHDRGGSLSIRHSLFRLNKAARGGAIRSSSSGFDMIGSTIERNAATDTGYAFQHPGEGFDGGGILFESGAIQRIVGSTISDNSADRHGGGIATEQGELTLLNSTISGNSGGAVTATTDIAFVKMELFNTTVTGNHSTGNSGGGLRLGPAAVLFLHNSIVAGNTPENVDNPDLIYDHGNSLVDMDVTTILETTLADNGGPTKTHALVPNSPAIDAGDDSWIQRDDNDFDGDGDTAEALDQRGSPRRFGARVDVGAVEMSCSALVLARNAPLAAASVGVAYSETIGASGGAAPYSFAAIGLPPGLTLSPTGVLSGTPKTVGTFAITVSVTDAFGCGGSLTFTLTIADPSCGIVIGPATLNTPYLAMPYYQLLSVTPSGQHTLTVSAGALPQGLYLFAIGRTWYLGGFPTKPGEYTFTIAATKASSPCAPTRTYTVTVPPTVLPQLTCVTKTGAKQYTAHFGYDNSTDAAVAIAVGADNYFTPGAQGRGQVTTFPKGRVTKAFSVVFTVKNNHTDLALWYLRGPDGVRRPVNITTATTRCP